MQNMSGADADSHDHGRRSTVTRQAKEALRQNTPFPRLAVWTTKLSSASINSFSGAVAGIASGIVTCPLDVIKTKLQSQYARAEKGVKPVEPPPATYHGMLGTARKIVAEDGARGLYRGLGPMLLGYLPTWAVYMSVYDSSREYYYRHGYGGGKDKTQNKWLPRIYASLTAGACSTLVTNPIWVIKTRLMTQSSKASSNGAHSSVHYHGTLDAARKMYHGEGMRAFYSGLAPALLGLTHVAIQFPLYEYLKQRFTGLEMGETPAESGSEGRNTAGILAATFLSKVCATTATYPHEVLRTRMQTQSRSAHPESNNSGVGANRHSQSLPTGKRVGNTDGTAYQPRYTKMVSSFRLILREEGWRAFYNGMGTNMIRAVPAAMTTMLTFESVKGAIGRLQDEGKEILAENG